MAKYIKIPVLARAFVLMALFFLLISPACAEDFSNPIGANNVNAVVSSAVDYLVTNVLAYLSILFILVGGIMYMTSGGDEKRMETAKKAWTAAAIGLAIALAAPTMIKAISDILKGAGATNYQNAPSFATIGKRTLDLVLSVLGTIAIISLVVGGMMYMTAGGDEKKMETGKRMVLYSIIGIAISLSAIIILSEMKKIFEGGFR